MNNPTTPALDAARLPVNLGDIDLVQTPARLAPLPVEPPAASLAPAILAARYTRHGLTIVKRSSGDSAKFTTRIRFRGQVHQLTLCETVEDSFKAALLARREIQAGRWAEYRRQTGLRSTECPTTLTQIEAAYRLYQPAPPKVLATNTKERNLQALRNILRRAGITAADVPLTRINGDLVYAFKQSVLKAVAGQPPEAAARAARSANSYLLQARSLFTPEAQVHYLRASKLELPASLAGFRTEPGFKQVAKTDYHVPADDIIRATFQALVNHDQALDRNMLIACWVAVGFGLRKNEIARTTLADFKRIGTDVVWQPDWFAKNKHVLPEVRVQFDAWTHLGPLLKDLAPFAYILDGTPTERGDDTFRRISDWMKKLGWRTTHQIHELRAWAGSQIADKAPGDGIRKAQIFLRHRSYATTEQKYGHHRRAQIEKIALTLPPDSNVASASNSVQSAPPASQVIAAEVPSAISTPPL